MGGMKRTDLAQQIARETRTSPAEAADHLDKVVHDLIRKLKHGKRAALPGLGDLRQEKRGTNPIRERA